MQISSYDVNLVIDQTSLQATREKREKKYENAGRKFFEGICYREGKIDSWKNVLDEETLKINEKYLYQHSEIND